jgi:hypothetical protein
LENVDFIIQPSSFWSKKTWNAVGTLREDITYAFDWEWFLRAKKKSISFQATSKCLSMYRLHENHKTGTGGNKRQQEILQVYEMYSENYAALYRMLLEDDLQLTGFSAKAVRKFLTILNKPNSAVDVLKFWNANRYNTYTEKEIAWAISML